MDWFAQIWIFGITALGLFIAALRCAREERYTLGALLGAAELLPAVISSAAWAEALRVSGKLDWFVLGVWGYPFVGAIFWCMLGAGIFAAVRNLVGVVRQKN